MITNLSACINQNSCSVGFGTASLNIFDTVNDSGPTNNNFLSFAPNSIGIGSGGFTNQFTFIFDTNVTLNSILIGTGRDAATTNGLSGFSITGNSVNFTIDETISGQTILTSLSLISGVAYTLTAEANNTTVGSGWTHLESWNISLDSMPPISASAPTSLSLILLGFTFLALGYRKG